MAVAVRAHPGGCAVLPSPTDIRAADYDGPDGLESSLTLSQPDLPLDRSRRAPQGSTLLHFCTAVYMCTLCEALPRLCWRLAAGSGSAFVSAAPFGGPEVPGGSSGSSHLSIRESLSVFERHYFIVRFAALRARRPLCSTSPPRSMLTLPPSLSPPQLILILL